MINVDPQRVIGAFEDATKGVDDKGSDSLLPIADSQADWTNRTKT